MFDRLLGNIVGKSGRRAYDMAEGDFIRPVLLGAGLRLFDHLEADSVDLELIQATTSPGLVHLRFRLAGG